MTSPDAQTRLKAGDLEWLSGLITHCRRMEYTTEGQRYERIHAALCRTPDAQPSSVETVPFTTAKCDIYGKPIPGEFVTVGTVEIEIEHEPSSTEGEVERVAKAIYAVQGTGRSFESIRHTSMGKQLFKYARAAIAAQVTKP